LDPADERAGHRPVISNGSGRGERAQTFLLHPVGEAGLSVKRAGGIERETSQVLDKVFASVRVDGISRGQIAESLSAPVDEISRVSSASCSPGTGRRPRTDPRRRDHVLIVGSSRDRRSWLSREPARDGHST
jgi:hypothetical protein